MFPVGVGGVVYRLSLLCLFGRAGGAWNFTMIRCFLEAAEPRPVEW